MGHSPLYRIRVNWKPIRSEFKIGWNVTAKRVPNFGLELGLGRVSYHLSKTRTRTYNASEYFLKTMSLTWTITKFML